MVDCLSWETFKEKALQRGHFLQPVQKGHGTLWKSEGRPALLWDCLDVRGGGVGPDLAGGFLRQKGLQLALSQMKTCKSERESCVYYEKVARASSPGRISVRGKNQMGLCPMSHLSFAWWLVGVPGGCARSQCRGLAGRGGLELPFWIDIKRRAASVNWAASPVCVAVRGWVVDADVGREPGVCTVKGSDPGIPQ